MLHQAHMNLGEIERRRGRDETARAHLETALTLAVELEDLPSEGSTRSLLALAAIDVGDHEAAELQLAALDRIARVLKDPELRAAAAKDRAHLAFVLRRPAEAARLYARAATMLQDTPSVQLAESLAGLVSSAAWRGQVEEEALQHVADLSYQLGWDASLINDLEVAFDGLRHTGREEQVVDVAAVALTVGLRWWAAAEEDEPSDRGADDPVLRLTMRVGFWLAEDSTTLPERRAALQRAVATVGGDEAASVTDDMLEQALAVIDELPTA
jgi:tetratricopeptide (TPR) repeat protein